MIRVLLIGSSSSPDCRSHGTVLQSVLDVCDRWQMDIVTAEFLTQFIVSKNVSADYELCATTFNSIK